ncbi:MAG: head completion/stabilization protein [Gammaproteobacteria bacterium]|nr:head completion/stabilization protein [Gammaproteobacteria bacterium]
MVFKASNDPNNTRNQTIDNLDFYPAIDVAKFRDATRLQDTVTDGRVVEALRTSVMDINRELASWRTTQEEQGYTTLAEVPADDYGPDAQNPLSEYSHFYLVAVYSSAKALLIEFYNDIDTSEEGLRRFVGFEATKDVYLREAREAIRNILGTNHATVELI